MNVIKPNRSETWGWSSRLKQEYVCTIIVFLGDESVCQEWIEKGGTTASEMETKRWKQTVKMFRVSTMFN